MDPLYHSVQKTSTIPATPGIYRITCVPTGKIYVGSAINLHRRHYNHFGDLQRGKHKNKKMQYAWNKYGKQAFKFEILEFVLLREFLIEREQHWMDTLSPFDEKGFNIERVAGSSLGRVMSQESREKSRATQLGRPSTRIGWHPDPEQIEKHRQTMLGKKLPEETKRNMAKAQTGRIHSIESREKRRQSLLGHTVSPETGTKIAAANRGRKASDETRAKLSEIHSTRERSAEEYASRRRTLILTSPDGIEYTVVGIHQFCIEHGLDSSSIAKVARGKYKHHRGWTARFPETV